MAIRSPIGTRVRVLLFAITIFVSSLPSLAASDGRRDLLAYFPPSKKEIGKKGEAIPSCRKIGSRIECLKNSKWCRWCRSEALDDMCFGSSEAWRLPRQVFSCDSTA